MVVIARIGTPNVFFFLGGAIIRGQRKVFTVKSRVEMSSSCIVIIGLWPSPYEVRGGIFRSGFTVERFQIRFYRCTLGSSRVMSREVRGAYES